MIDSYISPEMQKMMPGIAKAQGDMTKVPGDSIYPVLNMLNAKYIILPLQGGQTVPLRNPYAYGNGWFVDGLTYVNNANEELERVGKIDLRHQAVADKRFEAQLGAAVAQGKTSVVTLKGYKPNHLTYELNSDKGGVVVFSEVYYPGWTATIDNQPAELGRVNYLLRALKVPAGVHQVELDFHPSSIKKTETVAYASYGVLLLAVLFGVYMEWKRKKKQA